MTFLKNNLLYLSPTVGTRRYACPYLYWNSLCCKSFAWFCNYSRWFAHFPDHRITSWFVLTLHRFAVRKSIGTICNLFISFYFFLYNLFLEYRSSKTFTIWKKLKEIGVFSLMRFYYERCKVVRLSSIKV